MFSTSLSIFQMAYVILHEESEYDGVRLTPAVALPTETTLFPDSRIRVHLEESNDLSLPTLCKVLGVSMPILDPNSPEERLRQAHDFIADLCHRVNERDPSPKKFMLPLPASRVVRGFELRSSPTLGPRID